MHTPISNYRTLPSLKKILSISSIILQEQPAFWFFSTIDLFLLALELHINWIILSMLCISLLSVSIIFWDSTMSLCASVTYSLWSLMVFHYINITLKKNLFFTDGYLGSISCRANMDKIVTYIFYSPFCNQYFYFSWVNSLNCLYIMRCTLNIYKKLPDNLQKWLHHRTFPSMMYESSRNTTLLPTFSSNQSF